MDFGRYGANPADAAHTLSGTVNTQSVAAKGWPGTALQFLFDKRQGRSCWWRRMYPRSRPEPLVDQSKPLTHLDITQVAIW